MASLPNPPADTQTRADALREALATRVVVADGAMGTMLQAQDPSMEDFQQLEGCNEVLSVTRPDIVRSVHETYFASGVDCISTNTFGGNYSALAEYDIADRNFELNEASARIAREVADEVTASTGEQRWVLGSMGPGTKLPTLGHIGYDTLRDAYQINAEGLLMRRRRRPPGGDLPGPPPGEVRAHRRPPRHGRVRRLRAADLLRHGRDHGHDAARLGDRRGRHGTGAPRHRHARPELRHRPRRDERAPALPRAPLPAAALLHAQQPACPSWPRTARTTR